MPAAPPPRSDSLAVSPEDLLYIANQIHGYWEKDCDLIRNLNSIAPQIPSDIANMLEDLGLDDQSKASLKFADLWNEWNTTTLNSTGMLLDLHDLLQYAAQTYHFAEDTNTQGYVPRGHGATPS